MRAAKKSELTVVFMLSVIVAACSGGATSETPAAATPRPPATRKGPVTDIYRGPAAGTPEPLRKWSGGPVEVVDDYRWLEDSANAEVQAWSDAQNGYARGILDALPSRDAIRARVRELRSDRAETYFSLVARGGKVFAFKRQPPKQQAFLVVMSSVDGGANAKVVADPDVIDPTHSTSIDFFEPSPDGSVVAVSLSKGGSEDGDVHLFDVATGTERSEVVARVNGGTAGGDVAWTPDGAGFYYTRYPRKGERKEEDLSFHQQVYFHKLGADPTTDRYVIGREFIRFAEVRLETHPTEPYLLVSVQNGDGGLREHHLLRPDGKWLRDLGANDRVSRMFFGPEKDLFVVSTKDAPRGKLLRMPLAEPVLSRANTVVSQSAGVIEADFWESEASPVITRRTIFIPYQSGGPMELRAFALDGAPRPGPALPPVSAVAEMAAMGDDLAFLGVSFTSSPAWYRYSGMDGRITRTSLIQPAPVTFDDTDVVRKMATSKDGTKVPYVIIRPKGTAGKSIPMLVSGYGGYGASQIPYFNRMHRLLIDQGIGVVETVLRGGGEFGDEWHDNGRLTKKQNVFDDFSAVLLQLVTDKDTSPDRLGIIGGSNGGLLMGATLTQHPDLARVVISSVGIYDMLRSELSPNGTFNVPEFGTVNNRDEFDALYAYSPYHHVKDGTAYPSILFMTGANDPRVDPMQSRKMTARLQASGTARPVLLRTSGNTGHGMGTPLDTRIEQDTDVYSFLFRELGVGFGK